jgi:hypothetical protein
MWFIYSYFITIILSLLGIIFATSIKPSNGVKLKDFGILFFFFIPFVNYILFLMLLVMGALDLKDYCYEKLIENIKEKIKEE